MHIVNNTYMSLDGVVQRPELWSFDYRSDDVAKVTQEQLLGADALIMGRRTYDIFAPRWSTATDEPVLAERINSIPKYVLSHGLHQPSWNNTTVLAGDDVVERIRDLKAQPGHAIVQYGYGPVTRLLIEHGLLDELHIWLHPLLVGDTQPSDQIGAVGAQARFQLVDVRSYDSGLVILTYGRPDTP
ncbi:dihydrofolate reductase family protein [Pseudonocardia adelaidensis]|uniref:Dihydrofolate reductase family protein n=1 Tax=Pseudonocardia adelaidensis TaxID=648754 RepID=A0ABP9NUF5_9PSEU